MDSSHGFRFRSDAIVGPWAAGNGTARRGRSRTANTKRGSGPCNPISRRSLAEAPNPCRFWYTPTVFGCASLPVVPARLESGPVVVGPSRGTYGLGRQALGARVPPGRFARAIRRGERIRPPHRRQITIAVPVPDQDAGQPPRLGTRFTPRRWATSRSRSRVVAK